MDGAHVAALLEQIRNDIRLFGEKQDATDAKIVEIQQDMKGMQGAIGILTMRVGGLENRMSGVENRLGAVENRLGAVENRVGALENRVEAGFAAADKRFARIEEHLGLDGGTQRSTSRRRAPRRKTSK